MDKASGSNGKEAETNGVNNNNFKEPQTYVYEEVEDDNEEATEHHKDIVFKFISGRQYNISILSEVFSKSWRPSGTISITDLGSGYYNARFSLLCDIAAVMQGTPWSVKDDLMLMEKGMDGFLLEDYDFNYVVFGIHIYGLPFSMLKANKVFDIAKTFGDPEPNVRRWKRNGEDFLRSELD